MIKKQKIHSFSTEGANFKLISKDAIMQVEMKRDLFRSILFVNLKRNANMGEMSKFPLTPGLLCQTHIDGWMQKTTRSSLLKELETGAISEDP